LNIEANHATYQGPYCSSHELHYAPVINGALGPV